MQENIYTKSDMTNEVISNLKKETKTKVIGAKTIENFYNGTTKSDSKTIGAIKAWIALKTKEKNKLISSNNSNNYEDNADEIIDYNKNNR